MSTPVTSSSSWRQLLPGQRAELRIFHVDSGLDELVYRDDAAVIEAPNWSVDGDWLILNRDGLLYRIAPTGGELERLDTRELTDSNNDHVLSADGRFLYASSEDGHLYEVPLPGGPARRVTHPGDGVPMHYLHGISPDGRTLAFIGSLPARGIEDYNVLIADVATGAIDALTTAAAPHDGSEYDPSGAYVYFNSERASTIPGHSQLFRMDRDGSNITQLTFDERVNWFPHISPDGTRLVYLSYPAGTLGHPANLPVELRLTTPELDPAHTRTVVSLFGGQGTINVHSWAPDSTRFAYVAYPLTEETNR
ncbi:TolB family protein [Mycetocola saprophilus]|uniref:TolB family protein n=1 Tax=Mycetocola saprophilus TaxID=76636 RepID=UPI003BF2398B